MHSTTKSTFKQNSLTISCKFLFSIFTLFYVQLHFSMSSLQKKMYCGFCSKSTFALIMDKNIERRAQHCKVWKQCAVHSVCSVVHHWVKDKTSNDSRGRKLNTFITKSLGAGRCFYPLKFIKLYKCTITKQAETYKFNEKRGFSIQWAMPEIP